MKKEDIMKEMLRLVEWVQTLKAIPDELWFQPFREGSWATTDVDFSFYLLGSFFD